MVEADVQQHLEGCILPTLISDAHVCKNVCYISFIFQGENLKYFRF